MICREAGASMSVKQLFVCETIASISRAAIRHEVVGEHSCADPQLEAVASLGETALHAAASEQHRDAPLDAGAKALTLLEGRALLVRFALAAFSCRHAAECTPP